MRRIPDLAAVVLLTFSILLPATAQAISSRTLIAPTGEVGNALFGARVASAGDVNGDGYEDVIVGAHAYNGAQGRAYIYFGGPAMSTTADLTLTGEATLNYFGVSVASAGDVNGDGYADVIVGASRNGAGGTNAGAAYVFFGGAAMNTTADLTLTGEAANNYFGISVASAGDVNGDGYTDVIVGAEGYNSYQGRAYIYYGGSAMNTTADLTLTGEAMSNSFGASVASAGDVNGDGYSDVIVGADDFNGSQGRAYVFLGGTATNTTADLMLTGEAANDFYGFSVASAGDVNGDGYADVIVGGPGYNSYQGRACVYHGGSAMNTTADLTLTGEAIASNLGGSVASAGDVNGDGYADLVVGAALNDAGGVNVGAAYVHFGGAVMDTMADLTMTGEAASDYFGGSVASAGDVNGDGYEDVIVGANGYSITGRAYVVAIYPYQVTSPNGGEQWVAGAPAKIRWFGHDIADIALSTDGGMSYTTIASQVGGSAENEWTVTVPPVPTENAKVRLTYAGQAAVRSNSDASDALFRIVLPSTPPAAAIRLRTTKIGEAVGDNLGASVAAAGDINGDGLADVVVGAPFNDAGGANAGRAYVYYGGAGAGAPADLVLTGTAADAGFGRTVGSAGDVNGDGYPDIVIGADADDLGGTDAGQAWIYFGGPTMDASPDVQMVGLAAGDNLGIAVGTAGDVNGDGYADVIIGVQGSDLGGADAGQANLYFGGPGMDAAPDLTFTGEAAGDFFGGSVSTAGDVNGDGYSDVIVGSLWNDAGGVDAGRAYIYYGGPGMDAVADVVLTGAAAGDFFGSVAAAGDVNGDGYADVIVGASQNDAGGVNAGAAYVYYGGSSPDAFPDLVLRGAAANNLFGVVGPGGDVNGDGFSDMVAGSWRNSAGAVRGGRAYVYYGGTSPDATPDLVITGTISDGYLGTSVAVAGNVFGDECADLVVGAVGVNGYSGSVGIYDAKRYHVLSPNGGETWNVGAMKSVSWLGAEPADIWLSVNGGQTYERLESGVGGAAINSISLQVPHAPTKFAKLRVTPSSASVAGDDKSDSLFTIQTSISLLALLAAPLPQGGVSISWNTDPGPEDLSGYRLEGSTNGMAWRTVAALTRETTVIDPAGGPGSKYRLFAVNGFGEALWLGEASLRPARPIAAWPLPYRGGDLTVSFATHGGLGGGAGSAEVSIFDVSGRLVRTIARGTYAAGYQTSAWDGRNADGAEVAAGVYFLRVQSAGQVKSLKIAVLR